SSLLVVFFLFLVVSLPFGTFFLKTTLMFLTSSNTSFPSRCLGALPFSSVPSNSFLILRYLWLGGKNRRLLMYTNFFEPKRYMYCVSPKHTRHPFFPFIDRKSTRLNSSHLGISYAVFCLKKK